MTTSPPSSLVAHIVSKVKSALSSLASSGPDWTEQDINVVGEVWVNQLVNHPIFSVNNQVLFEMGTKLHKALTVVDYKLVASGKIDLTELLSMYDSYLLANQTVFEDITKHHAHIAAEKWSDVASNDASLSVYSTAAAAMGTKTWVTECNNWMTTCAYTYFRNGGAKKHFLKKHSKGTGVTSATGNDNGKKYSELSKDLMVKSEGQEPFKIRLLDVGSCYNPIAKSELADSFELMALDLYPADPSVYQCDFLNISIGGEGTDPIVEAAAHISQQATILSDENPSKRSRISEDADFEARQAPVLGTTEPVNSTCTDKSAQTSSASAPSSAKLTQLPAASFDAVTMSLVLNYLPTPAQRLQMVRNARALLVSPSAAAPASTSSTSTSSGGGAASQPHRNGLFIIAEKQSIFRNPHANTAPRKESRTAATAAVAVSTETAPQTTADFTKSCREYGGEENRDYWSSWVQSICSCGFELVKYHYFPTSDGRKSHMFAFATVGAAPPPPPLFSFMQDGDAQETCQMWIRQDHGYK